MKYRNLGKWGLKVSEVALGSWVTDLSGTDAEQTAKETVKAAFDNGVNFFDCADAYSGGAAEQIDKSLKNLRVDYIDLYFCHRFDPTTPVEETMQVLSDLVQQGKILYYGVSEWSPVQIAEALSVIKENHLRPLSVIQPQYNMADRYIEDEIVGICEKNGIGIVPFSPLAQGLLTGKYRKGKPIPAGSRATWQADKQINNLLTEENLDKVEKLLPIAESLGVPLSVLALAWILRLRQISSVITGASRPSQLLSNLAASGFVIPDDALRAIDQILDYKPFVRRIG